MAITYFNSASTPADEGLQAGPGPVAVTPPASMVAGDLVILIGNYKAAPTEDLTVSATGGQTWNTLDAYTRSASTIYSRVYWARFDGTWTADPSLVGVADTNTLTVVMHVFRPTTGSNTWAVDVAQVTGDQAAPTTPFDVTIAGITTLTDGALVLATWMSNDNNTWTLQTGGWTVTGLAQYRNTTGTDTATASAHKVQATAGGTGAVVSREDALANPCTTHIMAFKEVGGGAPPAARIPYMAGQGGRL